METNITRVPSVPLLTNDPYFSVWSPADSLYDCQTENWTGAKKPINGNIIIDGKNFRFMGVSGAEDCLKQTALTINPTATYYEFEGAGIHLTVKFTSPLLLFDPALVSRPCHYIDFIVQPTDGEKHEVKILIDFDEKHCHDTIQVEPMIGTTHIYSGTNVSYMGKAKQTPLNHSGDDITIDWGYLYVAAQSEGVTTSFTKDIKNVRNDFLNLEDEITEAQEIMCGLTTLFDFGEIQEEAEKFMVVAYDDVLSIMYFGEAKKAYWAKDGKTILEAIQDALKEYYMVTKKCELFDDELITAATDCAGENYAAICSLAYRQSIAGHKIIADNNGDLIFLSKENDSNGCIGTVDISYPSVPLYLLYNPEFVKGMMRPVFKFARLPVWKYDFAPHDVGRYPYATGQVYGLKNTENGTNSYIFPPYFEYPRESDMYVHKYQMPVEESGNMLIMAAAVSLAEGDFQFAKENLDLLEKWVCYLIEYGQDPGEQLCTDDFAGHLAHNVNLSAKAILGIASFGIILQGIGRDREAVMYLSKAKEMAAIWEYTCNAGDHTLLAFDRPDSWSLKYNIVWDKLFETGFFSDDIFKNEIKWYKKVQNEYGVPLDSRKEYTKSDWILWCVAMAEDEEDRKALIAPIFSYLENSQTRVPFSDWYDTKTANFVHFKNRTVQGGVFMPLLTL